MVLEVLRTARRLDKKLEKTVGRPYRVFLSAALITAIVHQVHDLIHAPQTKAGFVQIAIGILIGLLLLINQMGELSNRLEKRPGGRQVPRSGGDPNNR